MRGTRAHARSDGSWVTSPCKWSTDCLVAASLVVRIALAGIGFDCLVPVAPRTFGSERAGPVIIRSPLVAAASVDCEPSGMVRRSTCARSGGGCGSRQLLSKRRNLLGSRGVQIRLLGLVCRDLGQTRS